MWKAIYDNAVQAMATTWSSFINGSSDPDLATQLRDLFRNDIYASIGLAMILITILFCVFYYYILNNRPGYYFRLKYWLIALAVCIASVGIVTYAISSSMTSSYSNLHPGKFSVNLALINVLYSAIFFWVLSVSIKWWSPAKTTPRFYPY